MLLKICFRASRNLFLTLNLKIRLNRQEIFGKNVSSKANGLFIAAICRLYRLASANHKDILMELSPGQTRETFLRKHRFLPIFRHVSQGGQTLAVWATIFPQQKPHLGNMKCFWIWLETFLLPGKQILFPQQCFHGWANRETFEETSRVTNICLPRALAFQFNLLIFHWFSLT